MKLLFDGNISPKLPRLLAAEYPESRHVTDIGFRGADDAHVWDIAKQHGLTIVSKDTDFRERSFMEGFPPKVVWLDVGNAGTAAIADLLKVSRQRVEHFVNNEDASLLILSLPH